MSSRSFAPAHLARGSGRRGSPDHPGSQASASVIQRARQRGSLGHNHC